jgi:flagellar basal-body rod protein FlgB
MALIDLPIFSMIKTRLQWNQERQRVLAENVANSDTPKYRARDLVPPKFEVSTGIMAGTPAQQVSLTQTASGHIAGIGLSNSPFRADTKGRYEIRPTGNAVSLEDQMMKVAANQMDFQAASALYSKSLGLIKTALGKK